MTHIDNRHRDTHIHKEHPDIQKTNNKKLKYSRTDTETHTQSKHIEHAQQIAGIHQ